MSTKKPSPEQQAAREQEDVSNNEAEARAKRAEIKSAKKRTTKARNSFIAARSGSYDMDALRESLKLLADQDADLDADRSAAISPENAPQANTRSNTPQPLAFPNNNVNRWVPIGPSTVRQGQAEGRPRVSGRIKDIAVSANGQRIYAATAKGGVWYSSDGGATWEPIGGWASEPRASGGRVSAFACGCLLVNFGNTPATDFVMVGTGEIGDQLFNAAATNRMTNALPMRGMGVLVATAPGNQALQADPWEVNTGIAALEGTAIARMVRVPGGPGPGQQGDQVIAATTSGLFMGTRTMIAGVAGFNWAPIASPNLPPPAAPMTQPGDPTDLVYAGNRLFVCFRGSGIAASDNNGGAFRWLPTNYIGAPTNAIVGRMSMAVNDDNNTVYVLGEGTPAPAAPLLSAVHVWQINTAAAAPLATLTTVALGGAPTVNALWPGQRDYDQAIMVTTHTVAGPPAVRVDRVYIGGSLTLINTNWNASLWAFDVNAGALTPAVGVSDQPANVSHGATILGLIGDTVHPDVHAIKKATNIDGVTRQVWVGCDGGIFASLNNGQTNTFTSRNVGLASLEVGFVASHPTSSHFAMLGAQDNGRQVRVGESVWEVKTSMQGDGGGVIFHPIQSQFVVGQFIVGSWAGDPTGRFAPPVIPTGGMWGDFEMVASAFYSGISAIVRAAGNTARIALGTHRVWVTDNLGTANPNTWNVLPITPAPAPPPPLAHNFAAARDPRPGARGPSTPANNAFGVPPGFGAVITVKWVTDTVLLALYTNGIIGYVENTASPGNWASVRLLPPVPPAPVAPFVTPAATFFTDIEPVPNTLVAGAVGPTAIGDFYLTCTAQTSLWAPGSPPNPAADACFYFDSAAGGFRLTGLGQALPPAANSPIDPAYSVVVDPTNVNTVYVGTVTGVWTATKNPVNNSHGAWTLFSNGLPESVVQDLSIWTDPNGAANSPRLLRAALQSRGVWEVDLARQEPSRTYLRVHARDDRRMLPTPMKNPRRRPTAADVFAYNSPDIVIRPRSPVVNTPSFRGNITDGTNSYRLWTFQTAFRWVFPSVIPTGNWSDQMGDLVERYRLTNTPPLTAVPAPPAISVAAARQRRRTIDRQLWNHVMAAAQDEVGNAGVYRAPWQNALAPTLPGTEIDLMETVIPRRDLNNLWQVYQELSTVDVLLHHRDTRPVPANQSFVVLLTRANRAEATLKGTDCTAIPAYVRSLVNGPALPTPAGWTAHLAADGTPLHRLSVPLSARMPRSVAINIDLSGNAITSNGGRLMMLAIAGSSADPFSAVPSGPLTSVDQCVRNWPHAAARLVRVFRRPLQQIH